MSILPEKTQIHNRKEFIAFCKESNIDFSASVNGKIIFQYGKKKNGQRTGVVTAFIENGNLFIGWSKCKLKMDVFDKYIGLHYAINSAQSVYHMDFNIYNQYEEIKNRYFLKNCPHSLRKIAFRVLRRAVVQFKEVTLPLKFVDQPYLDESATRSNSARHLAWFCAEVKKNTDLDKVTQEDTLATGC